MDFYLSEIRYATQIQHIIEFFCTLKTVKIYKEPFIKQVSSSLKTDLQLTSNPLSNMFLAHWEQIYYPETTHYLTCFQFTENRFTTHTQAII